MGKTSCLGAGSPAVRTFLVISEGKERVLNNRMTEKWLTAGPLAGGVVYGVSTVAFGEGGSAATTVRPAMRQAIGFRGRATCSIRPVPSA